MREEFSAADFDGNGTLDVDELNELLKKMGYITDAPWSKVGMQTYENQRTASCYMLKIHDGTNLELMPLPSFEKFTTV